jgi:hypothetical protein
LSQALRDSLKATISTRKEPVTQPTHIREKTMKFICLGYGEENHWEAMAKSQQDAIIEECFAYDDELLKKGHWTDGGQALQSSRTAKALRWKDGKVIVTDGPFAETKEQLGGAGVLEAKDMDHAVELMSRHPGLRYGWPFEIRPLDEEAQQRNLALDAKFRSGEEAAAAGAKPQTTRFASLGYIEGDDWDTNVKGDFNAMIDQCIAFDNVLRKNGQWLGGMSLQHPSTAKTLRSISGKVVVTDGPYAETKEWLGGMVVLAFKDMSDAIALVSNHPALRFGVGIELRPIDEAMEACWAERLDRLQKAVS